MSLVDVYYYLFYKFYAFARLFYSDEKQLKFKATILMIWIEVPLIFTIINFKDILILKKHSNLNLIVGLIIPLILIELLKWISLDRNDNWRKYVNKFDSWTEKKNERGTWIVIAAIVIFFGVSLLSFYLNPTQVKASN
jgi:hypothetical protein